MTTLAPSPPLLDLPLAFAGQSYVVLLHELDPELHSYDVTVHLLHGSDGHRFAGAGIWNPFTRRFYAVPVLGRNGISNKLAKAVSIAIREAVK